MAPVFSYYERLMGNPLRSGGVGAGRGGGASAQPLQRRIFGGGVDMKPRKNWTPLDAAPEGAVDPTTGLGLDAMYQGDAPLKPVRLVVPGELDGTGGHGLGPGMGGGGGGGMHDPRDRGPRQPTSDWRGFAGWRGGNGLRMSGAGSERGGSVGGGIYAYAPGRSGVMSAPQFSNFVGGGGFGMNRGGGNAGGGGGGGRYSDQLNLRR
jgi:hypothetical protein